jgi:site-specific recombinase XerD
MNETLHQAAQAYLEHLRTQGKKERTLYTYGKDFEQIEAFFGAERKLSSVLIPHVGKFFKSDALLKLPNGRERSAPTVEKT